MTGSGVFVSYRKRDDPGWAGRVRDALAAHFGEEQVFFDVDSIRGGERWEDALDAALAESATLVLVIGPRWLECLRERQAGDETDYHLHEITTALDRGINVYPVRVHSAPMPDLEDLPDALRTRLPAIQWMEIYDNLFGPSMQRVIADIERATGAAGRPAAAAAMPGPDRPAEVTVAPRGTDADHHEIADALAAVADGGTVRVRPGRYFKPVVLDRPVAIVAEGRGEARLECDAVPCLVSRSSGAVVRGLRIASLAPSGAVGIRVEAGDLALDDVHIEAQWAPSSTGIEAVGAGVRGLIGNCEIRSVEVGIRVADGAEPRIERCRAAEVKQHALVVTGGADPKVWGCSFASTSGATVLIAEGGRGTIDESAIGTTGGPSIAITGGGSPTVRGSRGGAPKSTATSIAELSDRVAKRGSLGPIDDADRGGWTVEVHDGGEGRFSSADLASVRLGPGAAPAFLDCAITEVTGEGAGAGTFDRCEVGRVVLADGADPTFRSNCALVPDRGTKITVEIGSGAAGTFEDCEIVGRNIRDGSPDPAVRCDGGNPTLRRCVVKNPGEGAVWVTGGSVVTVEGGELRSSVSGPAVVVEDGTAVCSGGAVIRGGARVGAGGRLSLDDADVDADAVSGTVIAVAAGGSLVAVSSRLKGPGLAAVRKVGRWLEARSDKVLARTGGALGTSPPLQFAEGSTSSLRDCALTGMGGDALAVPAEGTTFEGCTLDDEPFP